MKFSFPKVSIEATSQGGTYQGYLVHVTVQGPSSEAGMILLMAPEQGRVLTETPPISVYASAAKKAVYDLLRALELGADGLVDQIMKEERRFSRRDYEEKLQMAEEFHRVAEEVGKPALEVAAAGLDRRMLPLRRPRPGMRGISLGAPVATAGGRQLREHGFSEIREIRLTSKGPGLWFEAFEPPPVMGPREWTPRAPKHKDQVLLLRQGPAMWHVFYTFEGTGSGGDPTRALVGGLGDAISTDEELEKYCELVNAAPARLVREYQGLSAAQGQCYETATQKAEEDS